ncbi:GUN4 domain-containing protein [Allocoleopsis franciscana]|uniref:GUN4-like domain-containing protein n=1 Tax=Allocoleopsis franciscana PCC 7113 TaxID=1173027 RepID=K9WNY1_9CYAN|nr:GUN4 domain-containing protein [Allocoleopsis franciscana]AFZ21516.1 hypothetical protein Mic7113_5912 [Allocoleopsis franciscana PCC 7113]
MAKTNLTAVILTLLVIVGLFSVAGALVWMGSLMKSRSGSTPSVTVATPTPTTNSSGSLNQIAKSDRQVDYSKLRTYLQQKNWKAADRETYERMLEAAGPQAQALGYTPQTEMDTLSCTDLKTIDGLWSAASEGKFGFTAQQRILKALGDYRKMYEQVGWQKLSGEWLIEWTYNPQTKRLDYKPGKEPNFTTPPPGHLPTVERGYNFDVSLDAVLKRCGF